MSDWLFFPWSVQYIVGAGAALAISVWFLKENFREWQYRFFFLFGMCVALWELFCLLYWSAPTASLARDFITIDAFFLSMVIPLAFLVILSYAGVKKWHPLVLLPAIVAAFLTLLGGAAEVTWAIDRWSYTMTSTVVAAMVINYAGYFACGIYVAVRQIKEIPLATLKRRYKFFIGGLLAYIIGTGIANFAIVKWPQIPPLGGVWSLLLFLFIALGYRKIEGK